MKLKCMKFYTNLISLRTFNDKNVVDVCYYNQHVQGAEVIEGLLKRTRYIGNMWSSFKSV